MSGEVMLFGALAICTLVSAGAVIVVKNAIGSAMSLVATFFFLAGIYVLLWAHTIAVLQVLVYAGAIMVLFLFVIMLLNLAELDAKPAKFSLSRVLGGLATAGLLAVLGYAISQLPVVPDPLLMPQSQAQFGTLKTIGLVMYTSWILPFEIVSLLLLVAIVGAVVVAKARI
ncbi:MAG: NADH-quinone oxidoreductase subunit J [Myxococcaceae bacterium]